jgi:RNA polymerase I-specific transcription initiation factor RRN5
MSSDADLDDHTRPSSRRHSSSPDSPRKRPRLRSTEPSRVPKHDQRRKSHAGARYSDDYRVLFNGYVAQAATRFDDDESTLLYSKQVGSSVWSPTEQAVFFAAIERLGKDNVPGIAGAIGSKTPTQVRDHVLMLQDAATKQGDAKLTLRDIPAAIEVGYACENRLEEAGDALAWFQERLEASLEQERYGEYWLITPAIAESIEHDYNGSARPRSASVLQGEEQSSVGSACQQCKAVKRKCDRGTPCSRCTKSGAQCVYVAKKPKVNSRSRTSSPQKLEDKESGSGIAG